MKQFLGISFFTLLLCVILIVVVDVESFKSAITSFSLENIFLVAFLVFFNQSVRATRFQILLSTQGNPHPFTVLRVTCIHQFLNHILPMRSGEMSFPFLLEKYGKSKYSSSLACLIIARLYDALLLLCCVLVGIWKLSQQLQVNFQVPSISWILVGQVALALMAFSILYFLYIKYRDSLHLRVTAKRRQRNIFSTSIHRLVRKVSKLIAQVYQELRLYKDIRLHFQLFMCSGLIWVSLLSLFNLFLSAAGLVVSWQEVIVGSSLASLTQLLPINTLGSVGTLEAGWVMGFSLLGLDPEKVLIAGVSMHAFVLAMSGIYAGLGWTSLLYKRS